MLIFIKIATSNSRTNSFDPFAPGVQAPAAQQHFGSFNVAEPVTKPQQNFNAFAAPQQSSSFDAFGSISQPQSTMNQFGFHAAQQQFMGGSFPQPVAPAPAPMFNQPQGGQFGGQFGGAHQQQQGRPTPTAESKPVQKEEPKRNDAWGAGSGLFDLNNLGSSSTNTGSNSTSSRPQYNSQNSFSGLDNLAGMPSKPMGAQQNGMGMGFGCAPMGGMGGMPQQGGMGFGGMGSNTMGGMSGMQQQGGMGINTMGGMSGMPQQGGMGSNSMGGMSGMPQQGGMGSNSMGGMSGMPQHGGMGLGGQMGGMPQQGGFPHQNFGGMGGQQQHFGGGFGQF
jgi:epsin